MSNKVKSSRTTGNNMFLVHDLNAFSAFFEQKMGEITFSAQKALGGPVSTVPVADVKLTFLRVNPWKAQVKSPVASSQPARISPIVLWDYRGFICPFSTMSQSLNSFSR